jgi:hypothetical protein
MDEELRADLMRWEQGELTTRDLLARYPKHQVADALAAHIRARAGGSEKPPSPGLTWARGGRPPPPDERRPAGTFLRRPLSVALVSLLLAAVLAATVDPIQRGAAEAWRRVTSFLTGEEPKPEVDRRAPDGATGPTQSPDTGRTTDPSRRPAERGLGRGPDGKQARRARRVSGRKTAANERRHASNRRARSGRKKDQRRRGRVSRDRHDRDHQKAHPPSRRPSGRRSERRAKQGGHGPGDRGAGTRYQNDRNKRAARARTQRTSVKPSQKKSEAG